MFLGRKLQEASQELNYKKITSQESSSPKEEAKVKGKCFDRPLRGKLDHG